MSKWCEKNVKLVQGLTPNLDLSIAPHMVEPLDAAGDNSIKELGWLWPPGAGKTTAIEGAIQWRIVCAPSNILLIGQKDETADIWWDTRMRPSMGKSTAMKNFMPSDRHKDRKGMIVFPHGIYLNVCGPSLTNLQEKSMPWVIFEEAWSLSDQYPGRFKEGEARTHDKWNSKLFYVGQAGNSHLSAEDDDSLTDLYKVWKRSTQREFHFECPDCKCAQPFKWDQLRYDKTLRENDEIDWEETGKTIRYECVNPECDSTFPDTSKARRMLASSLLGREQYRIQNPNHRKGCEFYHMNILALWRVAWIKSVIEWEDAMDAKARGDYSALKVFIQKRLAEFWTPTAHDEKHELTPGEYKVEDYADGQLCENELGRALLVDVQMIGVWFTLYAYTSEEGMMLLHCGQALSLDEIEEIRKQYKVNPRAVLVDSQYRPSYVFQKCAELGFVAFKGVPKDDFSIIMEDGSTIKAPYSKVETVITGAGKRTAYINFCVGPLKDTLAEMRAGRVGTLLTPKDVDPRFRKHLDAEVKRSIEFGREKRMKDVWVRIGRKDNHMLDCSMAAVGYGAVKGWIRVKLPISDTVPDP